jgi:hypothetical protein
MNPILVNAKNSNSHVIHDMEKVVEFLEHRYNVDLDNNFISIDKIAVEDEFLRITSKSQKYKLTKQCLKVDHYNSQIRGGGLKFV